MRALAAPLLLAPAALAAQAPARPAAPPPVRPLAAAEARAAEALGSAAQVRALPGGRVLVNDMARRRVLLFDSTLARYTVVADSTGATGSAYSGRTGGLIPFRGDSTLFVDPQSLSMLVIGPDGALGRTLSVPRPGDAFALTGLAFGAPGFDARGRLVYRTMAMPAMRGAAGGAPGGAPTAPAFPDSAPLLRVDLATRAVDTAAFVRTPKTNFSVSTDANGRMRMQSKINPLQTVDDWAVLSDGTLLVLRGRDFHADVAGADGRLAAAPKMPHEWQRLDDAAKQAFIDSTKTAMEKREAEMAATRAVAGGPGGGANVVARAGAAMDAGGGAAPMMIVMSGPAGGAPPMRGGAGAAGGPGAIELPRPSFEFVPASELPDYKPAFAAGGTRADADGRAWVRLIATTPMPGPVYAVVDRTGRLVDRVMLPAGATVAGFGPGGAVYYATRDAAGVHLHRARVTVQ
jgi:hypothetical protein